MTGEKSKNRRKEMKWIYIYIYIYRERERESEWGIEKTKSEWEKERLLYLNMYIQERKSYCVTIFIIIMSRCLNGRNLRFSTLYNSNCMATYFPSLKPFKYDEQKRPYMTGEERMNSQAIFSNGLQHKDTPVLVDQKKLTFTSSVWTVCLLEYLPTAKDCMPR